MKDDSLSDVHPMQTLINNINSGNSVGKQENVYAKQIWNDAIEAACVNAKAWMNKEYTNCDLYAEIRKLKK